MMTEALVPKGEWGGSPAHVGSQMYCNSREEGGTQGGSRPPPSALASTVGICIYHLGAPAVRIVALGSPVHGNYHI